MIAVATNLLVYARREDAAWREAALRCRASPAEGRAPRAIPSPCVRGSAAIAARLRIDLPPTPLPRAIDPAEAWLESPNVQLLAESEGYGSLLR